MALISLALAILAGLDTSLGYYASLARFFSFLPFFIIGHYTAHLWKKQENPKKPQHSVWLIAVLGLFLAFACVYIIKNPEITRKVLYASYSYEKANYEPVVKLFLIVVSFAWIAFLLLVMPSKSRVSDSIYFCAWTAYAFRLLTAWIFCETCQEK